MQSKQFKNKRFIFSLFSLFLYLLLYLPLYGVFGTAYGAFITIPVIIVASQYGMRIGVVFGVSSIIINTLMLNLVTPGFSWNIILKEGGGPGHIGVILFGFIVGKFRDLNVQLFAEVDHRKQIEKNLLQSQKKYQALFQEAPVGLFNIDSDKKILLDCNRVYAQLKDCQSPQECLQQNILPLPSEQLFPLLRQHQMLLESQEIEVLSSSGEMRSLSMTTRHSSESHLLEGTLVDITLRKKQEQREKRLEEQLRQSQKLETIGTLAGGIAHDFNNLLHIIFLSLDLLYDKYNIRDEQDEIYQILLEARERSQNLIEQILIYSNKSKQDLSDILVQDIIKRSVTLIKTYLTDKVHLTLDIDQNCPPIVANALFIQQIIMNLSINACQAMSDNEGTLTISLKPFVVEKENIFHECLLSPNHYIHLMIADTGKGIDSEIKSKIFEPFFTTKSKGATKGTGLGLAIVQRIISDLEGYIGIESSAEQGTSFHIFVPTTENAIVVVDEGVVPSIGKNGKKANILLVDDEKAIVQLAQVLLKSKGFSVSGFEQAQDALDIFQANPKQFDLVLSDISMPDMNGIELAKEIHALNPSVPIVLMTGYSSKILDLEPSRIGIKKYLNKPLDTNALLAAIEEVLADKEKSHENPR